MTDNGWKPIESAPKDGRRMELLIPYDRGIFREQECTTTGYWDNHARCFRFDGDDGPNDIQPTHFKPGDTSNEI